MLYEKGCFLDIGEFGVEVVFVIFLEYNLFNFNDFVIFVFVWRFGEYFFVFWDVLWRFWIDWVVILVICIF